MGEYYRKKPVYILKGGRIDVQPFLGIDADKIDYYMDSLFDYINNNDTKNELEDFIKSQIMHFYFVYIHPYFDVNGRTSRTLSMWYLLNKKAYPYIILNRAITFDKSGYEDRIINARTRGNITLFLKYMLMQVLKELEKNHVINNIRLNLSFNLSKEEYQILEYFISLNGNLTIKDLANIYNKYNQRKRVIEIAKEKIDPLIARGILINGENTKNYISGQRHNSFLSLNQEIIDVDQKELKYLKLEKYLKK